MSGEWLEESELSSDVVHLDSPLYQFNVHSMEPPLMPFII
jgi:hypothetical protein